MDLASLIGIVGGGLLIVWAIVQNGSLLDFFDPASIAITLGGTIAATMINYPMARLMAGLSIARNAFRTREQEPGALIQQIVGFAERARREGLLALEEETESAQDPFLAKGLGLVVDGTDPEVVRTVLENDLTALEERHKQGAGLFETMAQYAPAFGLVGTLIGLIQMLKAMDNPSKIGPGMAVALLTTLYGSMMANLVFTPIAGKLKVRSAEEVLRKEMMLEGVLAIQAGDGPSIIAEKLKAFLAPQAATGGKGGDAGDEEE